MNRPIKSLIKVFRFVTIYGFVRTLTKINGRRRNLVLFRPFFLKNRPYIGLVGCGQFQFSTIAYFLSRNYTNRFLFCFDIKEVNAVSLAAYYKIKNSSFHFEDVFRHEKMKLVYIASNHASHTPYSVEFLNRNINVYCEKPISVNFNQLDLLLVALKHSKADFYAGYNRPYSPAIFMIRNQFNLHNNLNGKFTLNCFVVAHLIPKDHWYRDPQEGTRICGNVGHWLDLMIHMYSWRGYIPKKYLVQVSYSSLDDFDENINISITTSVGDLTSVTITSRAEPFEGINETINFQYDSIIAKIDDFRKVTLWDNENIYTKRFFPKDVGHKRSVLQPFKNNNRNLQEIISSTELMIHISEMVKSNVTIKEIELIRNL